MSQLFLLFEMLISPILRLAFADMMNMSFDQLRGHVQQNTVVGGAASMGSASQMMTQMLGGPRSGGGPSMMDPTRMLMRPVEVPDHPQELHVLLFGPGAEKHATRDRAVSVVDAKAAETACKGKRDFILFEELDNAVRQGRRLVLVLPLSAGRNELHTAQCYLASSLGDWLKEQKTDGSGRPYGESKDEDPTLRKHFTRSQILAIRAFGDENAGGK